MKPRLAPLAPTPEDRRVWRQVWERRGTVEWITLFTASMRSDTRDAEIMYRCGSVLTPIPRDSISRSHWRVLMCAPWWIEDAYRRVGLKT